MSDQPDEYARLRPAETQLLLEAVECVLQRIKIHPIISYYMGDGTETYDKLVVAYARATGRSVEDVRQAITGTPIDREEKLFHLRRLSERLAEIEEER